MSPLENLIDDLIEEGELEIRYDRSMLFIGVRKGIQPRVGETPWDYAARLDKNQGTYSSERPYLDPPEDRVTVDQVFITPGLYRHYKGKFYKVTGVGVHTESGEVLVFYTSESGTSLYARPLRVFQDVATNGQPRFVKEL